MSRSTRNTLHAPLHRKPLAIAVAIASFSVAPVVFSQDSVLEEVLVTARKKTEAMQDIPVAMQALNGDRLQEMGISNFEDYAAMLPNLSFKSSGTPGSATIIMRGAADGGDGNASGSQPSVGLYLDEAPVTTIAANLDVHIYDIARIEALAGPQATLFGASSQSGTLRIITNKPDPDKFEARVDLGVGATDGGDESYSGEGMVNIPISDTAAVRLVGWSLKEGGWIDNVPGTRTYKLEGGYGYNSNDFGRTRTINNDKQVDDDINEVTNTGARAALKVDLNENWTTTASVLYQNIDADGVWEYDGVNFSDEDQIQRFSNDKNEDEFTQFALTIDGDVFNHNLVYAGSYLDRTVDYTTDYSAYGEDAYWVPYYACDYSATGANLETQSNTDCTSLFEYYEEDNDYTRQSHELRLQSLAEGRLQYTLGLFWQENEHEYFLQWRQPEMAPTRAFDGDNLFFRTDQKRTDTQFAAFGEVSFDITDSITALAGMRYYDEESEVKGVVGWGPSLFGVNDTFVDSKKSFDDEVYKFSLSWQATDDALLYATYAEGYRPGGLNRDPGLIETAGTQAFVPDTLDSYELGWKTTWLDQKLRFNGAIYYMEWDDIQYTIYDFSLSACCGNVYNLSTAEISGAEIDLTFLTPIEGLSVNMGASYNDGETTDDFVLPSGRLDVPDGTELPNVPEWKFASQWRYDFRVSDFDTYLQLTASYSDDSWSEIRPDERFKQDSYSIVNFRGGFSRDNWGVDLYVDNLTDEVADYYVQPRNYEPSTVTNRPINYGAKVWMTFD